MTDLRDQLQTTLGTAYTLERELGGGGMSRVFVATETALGRRVVVKVLAPELSGGVSTERFRREVQVAAQLRHPHVVPLLSAGEAGGLLYFTMPYVEGESLRARLARAGALPVGEAVRVLREVADALAYAHERGIVHRDIKPDNVLLERGHAVVTDFGIAKALSAATAAGPSTTGGSATGTGVLLGTPRYMAPEQAAGDPDIDHRADLYALGVLAYELLAGTPPFSGGSAHELVAAHIAAPPRPIGERRAELPAPLAALVMRLLEKRPADRPQSADDVLRVLEALPISSGDRAPEGYRARAGGDARLWLEVGVRHARTHRLKYATAIMLLALLLALAGIGVFTRSISRRSSTSGRPLGRDSVHAAAPTGAGAKSIAVLPFVNVGGMREDEYFSDGMTGELINALSRVEGLRVAARTSSFAFKGKELDVRTIGDSLNVGAVLEGSVRKFGDRLRVNAQLVDVASGHNLWSDEYDRQVKDVFAVQDELARAIVGALRIRLAGARDTTVVPRPTENLEAYDLYLKGRYAWGQRTRVTLAQAARYFDSAIALDPRFKEAYVGLAETQVVFPHYGVARAAESWPRAKAAAERALSLDSTLAEARVALALGKASHEWDWAGAEREFRRAIAEKPGYATAHHWYGSFLDGRGRLEEAVQHKRRALALDPLSRIIGMELGRSLYFLRRPDSAIAQLTQTLQLDPNFAPAHRVLGLAYLQQRNYAAAMAELEKAVSLGERRALDIAALAYARGVAGDRAIAARLLTELEERSRREYVQAAAFALIYTGLGDRDRAFAWLDSALASHDPWLGENVFDPLVDPLRGDPRFERVLQRLQLRP